jgi:SH3-like domain-containing protein
MPPKLGALMSNRGFLVFLLVVGGAVHALRSDPKHVPQAPIVQTAKPIEPAQEKPKLDLQKIERSLTTPQSQTKIPPSIAQPFIGDFTPRLKLVGASKVNVRVTPGQTGKLVAQLQAGTELNVVAVKEGWSQIKTRDGKVTGWISSNLLTERKAKAFVPLVAKPKPAPIVKLAPPRVARNVVVSQIIASSIQNYVGNCPCPYNTDRAGRSCGRRSAYSRPGGRSPICYPDDVTEEMIRQWISR